MILAIDTSTLTAGVAVVDSRGAAIAVRSARVTTHSECLLDLIAEALEASGVGVRDLSAVACGAGPGSFTGLRIGLSTAKGLCFATGAPLLMVSSLRAMARRGPPDATCVALLDAFKGEVYAGAYRGGGEALPLRDEVVLAPASLAGLLDELGALGPLVVLGEGLVSYPDLARGAVDDRGPPNAADVGFIAAMRLARGERDDLAAAVPSYVRASEAELAALARARKTLTQAT